MKTPIKRQLTGFEGVELAVWDYGGEGPMLLLCHCTGTLARLWEPVIQILMNGSTAESSPFPFHVMALDARGHGDSGKPMKKEDHQWRRCGHDILAVIEQFGAGQPVYAVGHSGGGAHLAYAEVIRRWFITKIQTSRVGAGQ